MTNVRLGRVLAFACTSSIALATPALCQTAPVESSSETPPTAVDDDGTIQDIVVTAERRPSVLQRTPIAVTVLDGEDLEQSGVANLLSAVDNVPSVQIQSSNIGSTFYIRGVGARGQSGATPVSTFIDGVYQQQNEVIGTAFSDLERIEVLRGPQGTLYGRNANAGTINLITRNPTLGEFSGRGGFTFGNYNTLRAELAANLPLGQTVAVRVVGALNLRDGYLSNGLNDEDSKLLRAKLLFQPVEQFRLLLSAEEMRVDANGPGNVLLPTDARDDPWESPDFSSLFTIPFGQPIYCNPNCDPFFTVKNRTYTAQADYDFSFATLTGLVGIQRFKRNYGQPFSGLWEIDRLPLDQESYELRLASNSSSPIQWVVGGYALDVDNSGEEKFNYSFGQYTSYAINTTRSRALFGQATVPIQANWRATAGLRFTEDSFRRRDDIGAVNGSTGVITVQPVTGTLQKGSYDKVTFKLGTEYDLSDRSMLYAQYSTGFRSGGVDPAGGLYDPESIKAFEIGSKNRLLDNRLQLNAAAYLYNYTDYQLNYYVYLNGGLLPTFVTDNVPGKTKIWGIEIEGQFKPTPNDRFDFSGSYQKTRFGDAQVPTSCNPAGVCTITDLSGRTLPRAPKFTGTAGYEHEFGLASGASITARAEMQYKSSYFVDLLRFNYSKQESYVLGNARITYADPSDSWTLGAYINNIGDEPVLQQANTAGPVNVFGVIGEPRTYGLVATAKF